MNDKGALVKGVVKSADAKGAVIQLDSDVEGYLRASEVSRDRVEDIRTHVKEGDEVETVIIAVDRKARSISLSIKAKDMQEEKAAMGAISADASANVSAGTTSLGALLKAKLSGGNE
ncbi:30S ribosomal protein S1 [compost metagenome]|jgi:small subunit ribosomal protein S1